MITAGYRLNESDRAQLMALRQMPGYAVLINIFESQVSQFQMDLVNVNAAEQAEILAKHSLAKAAAQFYGRVMAIINEEANKFSDAAEAGKIQADLTEALFSE